MIICLPILVVVLLASWLAAPFYHKKRLRQKIERAKHLWAFDGISVNEMRRLLQMYEPSKWITTDEERKFCDELPEDGILLYRGGSLLEQLTGYGISWSKSNEVAKFHAFACGKEQRAVFVTIVPKSEIRAVLLARDEAECLVLEPANVKVVTTEPTELFDRYRGISQRYKAMYDNIIKMHTV